MHEIKKQQIAIVCNYRLLPERVGGMDYFFWRFDRECRSNGISVDWFFPNKADHGEYSSMHIIAAGEVQVETCFLQYVQQNKADYSHIITHFVELCTPFFYRAAQAGVKTIIAVDHNPRPLKGYPVLKRMEKRVKGLLYSRYINHFIAVSKYTEREIIRDFGSHLLKKTQVIYNGIQTENFRVSTSRSHPPRRFIVASHLRQSKGIQDLIRAIAEIDTAITRNIVIDMYGDGPFKENLVKLTVDTGTTGIFNFKGSKANLYEIYADYDYMLQPTHMECFSLSILESLASNVPVLTTDAGGNTEVIKHGYNGFITDAGDVAMLARQLGLLLTGEDKIAVNTRTLIDSSFSINRMVNKYYNLLGYKASS